MCQLLFAFTTDQCVVFDVKGIWAIFYHFFDALIILLLVGLVLMTILKSGNIPPGSAKC